MAELTVDLTYGRALFQAACETDKKDIILEEGNQVLNIFTQEPELFTLIGFPTISAKEKKDVLKSVFSEQICQELLNLLYVLVDKGRVAHFPKIMKTYKTLLDKEEGHAYGTIYSVVPLSETQLEKFEEETTKLFKTDTKLENKIDPKLIGGVKILVNGKILDASLRKRLIDLQSEIN